MKRPEAIAKTSWILTLASIAVVVAALYLAKALLIPLTLAVLLSFMLSPICGWMERWRLSRIPAVLMTAFFGFSLLGIVLWLVVVQLTSLSPKIPEYQHNIGAKFNTVNQYAVTLLSKLTKTAEGMGQNLSASTPIEEPRGTLELPFSVRVLTSPASPLQVFGGMYGTLLEVLGSTSIVIVLVIFFLVRREDLRDRFIHLIGKTQITLTTQTIEDAGARVSRYLSTLLLINLAFGISVGIGLYLIGVPNVLLWGILAMALRFIPYIGPWIAAVMPIGLSMAISTGWLAPLLTVGLFVALELFNNNLLEPWVYGKNTGVSAVAVLIAAFFWMWLWGPVGLLLATALTVCILVVGKHVPELSFLDILLGSEPVFEPQERIYQRLVAGDQEEAAELFEEHLQKIPLVEVYDTVLIPALAMAETHWQLGELNDGKHKFIMQSLKDMIQYHGESLQRAHEKSDIEKKQSSEDDMSQDSSAVEAPALSILCIPARTEADEITAMMLAQVLANSGRLVQAISLASLASELVDIVEQRKPDVICLSATPPAAAMHARHLCKRLRDRLPEMKLVVGLWDVQDDLSKARERIGLDAMVVAKLADAQGQIRLLSQPRLSRVESTSI
ncbi:MAG: AI-2E family transporter [Pirellula sp.]|jgi:predicted PurR-regulated permease PerM/methanogenic corrinoid protein MtbC1|nr:AI-2E family transporter [Pirellula sp.]